MILLPLMQIDICHINNNEIEKTNTNSLSHTVTFFYTLLCASISLQQKSVQYSSCEQLLPQTCGREIHPGVILNFSLAITFPFLPSCVFRCLAFLEISTGSVYCTPDENDRPFEQTNIFCSCQSMLFLTFLFGELAKLIRA